MSGLDPSPLPSHTPKFTGGPCTRCGLSYASATAYVACLEAGDSFETWAARQLTPVLRLVEGEFVIRAQIIIRSRDPVTITKRKLWCPHCGGRHIDSGEWATRPHHKHLCESCGHIWREEEYFAGVGDES